MSERSPIELILAHQKRLGEINSREPEPISALEYLQSIYRNPTEDTSKRMRAAIESLPYENPKITAVAVGHLTGQDFYNRLEAAIKASNKAKLIEARTINEEEN